MKKFVLALGALAVLGISLPVTSAQSEESKIVIRDRDHDRGEHRGWMRHRDGWERHHRHARVVVISHRRHHDRDHDGDRDHDRY
ncbi:MAG: hypothetical protein ACR2K5_02200 [Pseudolabrys sp.]